jgi:N-carbamoylputrescine amidase
MDDIFTIGLVQHECVENLATNHARAEAGVREAAKRGAKIICLQELYHWIYFCTVEDAERFNVAESVPGPSIEVMQRLAAELSVVIIVPFFERRGPGVYHNSAAVIDADGSNLGLYRKMHIPDDPLYLEKFYFAALQAKDPARDGFRVFKTRYATIGVLICWDQWYPEAARLTALLGAEVLFYPTAIGWHPFEQQTAGPDQLAAWQTIQRAHAVANGIYVAAVNRVGHEKTAGTDGIVFFGHSFVAGPFGQVITEDSAQKPCVLVAECSRKAMEQQRRDWPFLRDRRIEAYSGITSRWLAGS